jgi:hypothetical protein
MDGRFSGSYLHSTLHLGSIQMVFFLYDEDHPGRIYYDCFIPFKGGSTNCFCEPKK